ncbi:RRM domain-containing protein [Cryptosporidium ubiquitum]|uniref:RRM domain-containing protein n=1 Tax=Cryptosporidium ubiquitum TaxID=857276 RepID=A0A1J4M9F8_9CRYT|nr:RRM domain-containing protein [Cryptosporidium ubiquitum]OII70850.1 RRM domain-containing protein [Cryptosporidium ubiquitum]
MKNLIKNIDLNPTIAENHLRFIELSIKSETDSKKVEQLYEGALSVCGLHPTEGPIIWSEYRRFLNQQNEESLSLRVSKVRDLFYRQMSLPLSGLPDLLDEYRIWEEELPEENRESFNIAKEHYSKGQQEWSLKKPFEMRVQTDNVSNLQELFDAWMLYINFEKDRMLSIDYSSDAEPLRESSSGCDGCDSSIKYKFDTKDSVIMAYRRALDDLGSIRIDLWLEFANFISTTTNCPHLLSAVYASSLQHFSGSPKLWMFYLSATAEAIKDMTSHFYQFNHFYGPGCKTRSSATWYPQNCQILKITSLKEMLETLLENYISELSQSQEIFSKSKQDALELYFVVTNSLIDINKSLKFHSTAKKCSHLETDDNNACSVVCELTRGGADSILELEKLVFGELEKLYFKGEELLLENNVRLVDKDVGGMKEEFHVLEESAVLFYSRWLDFELSRSANTIEVAISMLEKFLDKETKNAESLLPLIISVIKGRLTMQDQLELRSNLMAKFSRYSQKVQEKVLSEWENAENDLRYTNSNKRQRLDITERDPNVLYSPNIGKIPLGISSSSSEVMPTQEVSQCILPSPILQQGPITNTSLRSSGLGFATKTNDNEGDFVCLSEIRLRRDKRRSRRNFTESDHETSSECSSESNSFSALLSGSGTNGGRQFLRNFTPPGTPSYAMQRISASIALQNHNIRSPSSPTVTIGVQQTASHLDQLNSSSFTMKGNHLVKSPGLAYQDLEARTQCTWDGREAIEPSIAPPIPPIPPLSSISSVSSTSSHSSLGTRQFEKSVSQIASVGEQQVLSTERTVEGQNMPPPPYTPKKSKLDRSNGKDGTQKAPSIVSVSMVASASEDSDLNSNSNEDLNIAKDLLSNSQEEGTLFIRFPQNQEMDEEKLRGVFLEHLHIQINQVRIVRDPKKNPRGFAYIDVDTERVFDIMNSSEELKKLEEIGIQVSVSNPPKPKASKKNFSSRGHSRNKRHTKKKQIQNQQDSSNTILIKNIDKSLDEKQIISHFQDGLGLKVKNISISRDQNGASRGFAFMEFFDSGDALAAHMLNESRLGSNNITVSSSTRPLTFPRSANSEASSPDFLNARFAPRVKSKQKLPPGCIGIRDQGVQEDANSSSIKEDLELGNIRETTCKSSSLTNDDFRKLFL